MRWIRLYSKKKNLRMLSDEELIDLFKQTGDEAYASTLFLRYVDKAYIITRKYLSDREETNDLVMIVFEKVLKNLPKTEVRSFNNWLHTIIKNECHYFLRRQSNQTKRIQEWGIFEKKLDENVENDPLTHLINKEDKDLQTSKIIDALEEISADQRICIQLFFFEKKSYKEITIITGFTDREVKSHIQNGKKNLKKLLQ